MTETPKTEDRLWRAAALALAVCGLAGFILLFVRGMNVYWFILSPIILAVYEMPAVAVYAAWKRRRAKARAAAAEAAEEALPASAEAPPDES